MEDFRSTCWCPAELIILVMDSRKEIFKSIYDCIRLAQWNVIDTEKASGICLSKLFKLLHISIVNECVALSLGSHVRTIGSIRSLAERDLACIRFHIFLLNRREHLLLLNRFRILLGFLNFWRLLKLIKLFVLLLLETIGKTRALFSSVHVSRCCRKIRFWDPFSTNHVIILDFTP